MSNLFPTEKQIREADYRRDLAKDDRATGDSGPSFHELWAQELDLRASLERVKRLDTRAWSRMQGLAIDSAAFKIRARRAAFLTRRCDELYREIRARFPR